MQRDLTVEQGPGTHTHTRSSGCLLSPTFKSIGWRHSGGDGSTLMPLSSCAKAEAPLHWVYHEPRLCNPKNQQVTAKRELPPVTRISRPDHLNSVNCGNSGTVTFQQAVLITNSSSKCTRGIFVESFFTAGEPSAVFCT